MHSAASQFLLHSQFAIRRPTTWMYRAMDPGMYKHGRLISHRHTILRPVNVGPGSPRRPPWSRRMHKAFIYLAVFLIVSLSIVVVGILAWVARDAALERWERRRERETSKRQAQT